MGVGEGPSETPTIPVTAARPTSTELEPVESLEGVLPLVQLPYAFPSRRRNPNRPVVPARLRFCQGCSHPHPRLGNQAAPSFTRGCCDSPVVESFHLHPVKQRLVAHRLIHQQDSAAAPPASLDHQP